MRSGTAVVCVGVALTGLSGCHGSGNQHQVGGDLPVSSSRSVSLPGATDAADARRAPEVAESQAATLTTWRDPATGVSFQYPTVWRPFEGSTLPVPEISELGVKPRISEAFSPKGNYYQDTVLRGLNFSYGVKDGTSAADCLALPGKNPASAGPTRQVTYNGTNYTEDAGSDAGMCTQVRTQIDATYQGGHCFVFERDFVTSCPDVKTATTPRPLTDRETAALQRHLDAVMQSVTIAPGR